jgi:hypothetical protein
MVSKGYLGAGKLRRAFLHDLLKQQMTRYAKQNAGPLMKYRSVSSNLR